MNALVGNLYGYAVMLQPQRLTRSSRSRVACGFFVAGCRACASCALQRGPCRLWQGFPCDGWAIHWGLVDNIALLWTLVPPLCHRLRVMPERV